MCLGLLLPAWAFTGLDSAEYMAEETQRASRMQPRAILMGCVAMFVFGLGLIVSLLFSMPVSVKHAVKRIICRA
jgi:amino acid transporter